jgi:hypothetical protein
MLLEKGMCYCQEEKGHEGFEATDPTRPPLVPGNSVRSLSVSSFLRVSFLNALLIHLSFG